MEYLPFDGYSQGSAPGNVHRFIELAQTTATAPVCEIKAGSVIVSSTPSLYLISQTGSYASRKLATIGSTRIGSIPSKQNSDLSIITINAFVVVNIGNTGVALAVKDCKKSMM